MKKFVSRIATLTMALSLGITLTACIQGDEMPQVPVQQPPVEVITEEPAEEAPVEDVAAGFTGTLTGVGSGGFGGDITVEVTFADGVIVALEVVDHSETQMFLDMATPIILPAIIEANSVEVDTVTSVTMSSRAIINAVLDAIAQK